MDAESNSAAPHVDAPHVLPVWIYLAVFGGLLAFTALTVRISLMDLGRLSIYPAMIIACIKAGLVLAVFMHLAWDSRFTKLLVATALLFVGLLFSFTMLDVATRGRLNPEEGNFRYRLDQGQEPDAPEGYEAPAGAGHGPEGGDPGKGE